MADRVQNKYRKDGANAAVRKTLNSLVSALREIVERADRCQCSTYLGPCGCGSSCGVIAAEVLERVIGPDIERDLNRIEKELEDCQRLTGADMSIVINARE